MKLSKRVIGYGSRKWQTKEGTVMRWSEMTVQHLRNCAALLRRRADEELNAGYSLYSFIQGEMASYYLDCDLRRMEDENPAIARYADEMDEYADYREQHIEQLKRTFK